MEKRNQILEEDESNIDSQQKERIKLYMSGLPSLSQIVKYHRNRQKAALRLKRQGSAAKGTLIRAGKGQGAIILDDQMI